MDVKEAFTERIGPLPAIAWAGIAGGGYVIYRYIQAKNAAATGATTTVDTQGADFGLSQDGTTPISGVGGVTGTGSSSSVITPTTTTGQPMTNVDYGTQAENWAIAQGFNPTDVATALGSYLYGTGQTLNSTQSAILQSVLKQFGSPPEGVIIPPPTTPNPPIQTTPAPSAPTGGGFSYGVGNETVAGSLPTPAPVAAPAAPAPAPAAPAPAPVMSQAQYMASTGNAPALVQWLQSGGLIAGPNDQGVSSSAQIAADINNRVALGYITPSAGQLILAALH